MKLEGFFNEAHLVRLFLAKEYAFVLTYGNKRVHIAHTKGSWSIAKMDLDIVLDHFVIHDCQSGFEAKNELTSGLIEKMMELDASKESSREADAALIFSILEIWAGNHNKIQAIHVMQPGRNAWVDEHTGMFSFSPRENEFYK